MSIKNEKEGREEEVSLKRNQQIHQSNRCEAEKQQLCKFSLLAHA